MKLSRKKVRFQLRIAHGKGRRSRDNITRTIVKLATVMSKQLKRLSSERTRPSTELLGARKLELIMTGNKYNLIKREFRQTPRSFPVPRPRGCGTMSLACNYWHELGRKEMELMVWEACKKSSRNTQKLATHVALRASQFSRVECRELKLERQLRKMEEYNIPYDPYKPLSEEQSRILRDLPLFRRPEQVPELMFSAQPPDPSRLRQTKISDYFNAIKVPNT